MEILVESSNDNKVFSSRLTPAVKPVDSLGPFLLDRLLLLFLLVDGEAVDSFEMPFCAPVDVLEPDW